MLSSTTMAGRLSTKMAGDKQLLVPNRHNAGNDIVLVDKVDEKVKEINANYFTSEVSRGLGSTEIKEHEMAKKNAFFEDKIVDNSHNERVLEEECHGDDRDVDIMVDDSPPERERTTKDVAQTTSQTKNVRFEKGAKDDDGSHSWRRRRRNDGRNRVDSNQESAPTCRCWKRVRKFFGKQLGRVLSLIGMGTLVLPPGPGGYVPVQSRSWSENQTMSPSYGMLLF